MDHDLPWNGDDDAYRVLGVGADADDAEILTAYRDLARRHHPDIAGESHTARMSRINAAFDQLRDAERRHRYDRATGRPRRDPRAAPPPPIDPTRPAYGWVPERDGTGGAGPPPGRPSGSVLTFGRHLGWSIGEIARVDPGYLEWLEGRHEGRRYAEEIDATLRRTGYRPEGAVARSADAANRFRRFGWS